MIDELFSMEKLNVLSDDDNYYFFRALNTGDNDDIEKGITIKDEKITKIRTDRKRYTDIPKYNDESSFSLEEAVDHIKPNHRKDTNCISLSSSANVSLNYGREYYNDKYVLIRIPKSNDIINAITYLLKETEKLISNKDHSNNEINLEETSAVYYDYLDEEQRELKNSIINKLLNTNENILKNISNYELAQTINNAVYSCEFIHYGDINEEEIINIPAEYMDAFSLLEQLPNSLPNLKEIKDKVLSSLLNNNSFERYSIKDINSDLDETYKKYYYLARSCLRRLLTISFIKKITDNKYKEIYSELLKTYGVEKLIFSKCNTNKLKVNDKVNLDFSTSESSLIEEIHNMKKEELIEILDNPQEKINLLLTKYNL